MTKNNINKKMKSNRSRQLGLIAGGVDRISNLPDSIIHHIVSFLDTKSAVRTCLLSKQWESTWKHVHSLNLDVDFDEYSRYETFVDKVLSFRYPLHVSKVVWNPYTDDTPDGSEFSLLRRIVQYAASHGARHFILRDDDKILRTPLLELFDSASDTVRTLEVEFFTLGCLPVCPGFQLLTTLELVYCQLLIDREHFEPFSQFPCLKDLVLKHCWWGGEDEDEEDDDDDDDEPARLRVSGSELSRLNILDNAAFTFEIFAPKLESFKLLRPTNMESSELSLPSLVHADIGTDWRRGFEEDDCIDKEHLVILFNGLHNVESLEMGNEMSEVVRRNSMFLAQQPCPFTNLKKLSMELDSGEDIPYNVMTNYFFNGSSNARLDIPNQILKGGICRVVMMQPSS